MLTLFICSLNREITREHGVDGTLGQAYTNSVPDQHSLCPFGQHELAIYTKCVTPMGQLVLSVGHDADLLMQTYFY